MRYTGVRHTSRQKGVMRYVMRCVIRWHWHRVSTCNRITLTSLQHDVIHAGGVGDDSLKCGGTSGEEEGVGGGRHEAKSSKVGKTDMVRKVKKTPFSKELFLRVEDRISSIKC